MIEITRLSKIGGPLTKQISLDPTGTLISDGSACVMWRGRAQRVHIADRSQFADLLQQLEPNEAIALGALRADLPEHVKVTTKDFLTRLNGAAPPGMIARTAEYITYEASRPALALIDVDTKGMPAEVKARIKQVGGFWAALVAVLPALEATGRIERRSTSTGISRSDTGEPLAGSSGMHFYLHVQNGADVERFLRTLHERCWLSGFGWHMVGTGGQLLDRSLVDRMVFAPERLVFEGAPIVVAPLVQDLASRRPLIHDGDAIDTLNACPALRITEVAQLKDLKSRSAHTLAPARAAERERFISVRAGLLADRVHIPATEARRIIERQCDGFLLPVLVLPWDHEEFAGCTVADVLADPGRFVGATLADPLEGVEYGRTKAMVMRRADGSPWINSFAHGHTVYELRYDARAATAAVSAAAPVHAADAFVRIAPNADLDADQMETLRNQVCERAGVGKRALDAKLRAAQAEHTRRAEREADERKAAERRDPRPQIIAPDLDAPWLPQMEVLNDVLGASSEAEPPMRDIDGVVTQVRVRHLPNMHAFTSQGANEGETKAVRLPAIEQPLLTRLDEIQLAELIERHVDYIDKGDRSVHLAAAFVKHYHTRSDNALPTVTAVTTLPIVLPDGTMLSKRGLDRSHGIVFRAPQTLISALPKPAECTPAAVAAAMRFLIDQWLCDVSADYTGKCILIAAALSIIERSVIPERPAFFVTAGRRGGGKTTALTMLLVAVTGLRPSAAAWSSNEEERRKSLLSYLMEALPAIIWDNIPRGTQISCPHIEKSCTSAFYSDRRLGVSEMVAVSASVVHLFTGNNIGPRGDLASRSLQVRLQVDRTDPENRTFTHADPIGWTEANRPKILAALFVVLLGNPALLPEASAQPQTRFKGWWRLVGSAVENGSRHHKRSVDEEIATLATEPTAPLLTEINFRDLFLSQEEDDDQSSSLADVLTVLARQWPDAAPFAASDVARLLNDRSDETQEAASVLREFLFPNAPPHQEASPRSVGKLLAKHVDEPVKACDGTLILEKRRDAHTKAAIFYVLTKL